MSLHQGSRPPPLPDRSQGVKPTPPPVKQKPKPKALDGATSTACPTMPIRPLETSSKPILPPRLPARQKVAVGPPVALRPALPSRDRGVSERGSASSHETTLLTYGRTRPPKYEDRDFSVVDDYVRGIPEYPNTHELAHALTCNFGDEVDRVRAIFDWVAFNIVYDFDSFIHNRVPPQSSENVFRTKSAVCAGYSRLFQELCDYASIQSVEISGYGKGFGYDPAKPQIKGSNHAWNAVFVESEWQMIESTWGAGSINNGVFVRAFVPFHFLTDPDEFLMTHMPTDDTQQFTRKRYTWEEFFALNTMTPNFFKWNLVLKSHVNCGSFIRTPAGKELRVLLTVPEGAAMTAGLENDKDQATVVYRKSASGSHTWDAEVVFRPRLEGPTKFQIYMKDPTDSVSQAYPAVAIFYGQIDARTTDPTDTFEGDGAFPLVYTAQENLVLQSPLTSPLALRTTPEFVMEDLSRDAASKTHELYLYMDSVDNAFRKTTSNGRTLYKATKHIVKHGQIKIARKVGNSYSHLVCFDV